MNELDFIADGKGKIIAYEGQAANIEIPDIINNVPITAIGEGAFFGLEKDVKKPDTRIANVIKKTDVKIPGTVTSIGVFAFAYNKLTSIVIPSEVTFIGMGAFIGNRITSITIGNSVVLPRGNIISFEYGFDDFYEKNWGKAGTYTFLADDYENIVIPETIRNAKALLRQGWSIEEIAKALNISENAVNISLEIADENKMAESYPTWVYEKD